MLSNFCQSWPMTMNTQRASRMSSFLRAAMSSRNEWARPLSTRDFSKKIKTESLQIIIDISKWLASTLTIQHRQASTFLKAKVVTVALPAETVFQSQAAAN